MRALLFLFLLFIFAMPSFAQQPQLSPLQIIETTLLSQSTQEQIQTRKDIYNLFKLIRNDKEIKKLIPVYTRSLKTLYSISRPWQSTILKKLLPLMDQSSKLELISLQVKGIYGKLYDDKELTDQYNFKMGELSAELSNGLPQATNKFAAPSNLLKIQSEQDKKLEKMIQDQIKYNEIDIYDGFTQQVGSTPLSDEELKDNIFKSITLHQEIKKEELRQLSELDHTDQGAVDEFIKSIDTDNLVTGGENHPLGKAKNTLIYEDSKQVADLITKVVLNDSPDAHIIVPANFNIHSKHFKKYLGNQHLLAGASDMGFKDQDILKEKAIDKGLFTCFLDYCYDTQNSEHRLKRSYQYWLAKFKEKNITRGRNVYIYMLDEANNLKKVIHSPKMKFFSADFWKKGKGFRELGKVYYEKATAFNFTLGATFGLLQGAAASFAVKFAKQYLLGQEEELVQTVTEGLSQSQFADFEGFIDKVENRIGELSPQTYEYLQGMYQKMLETPAVAYLSFTYATVIGGWYGFYNNIVKTGKKTPRILKNFALTTLTFGYAAFALNYYIYDDANAVLNIFAENSDMAMRAFENHYKIWGIGYIAKYISENYKVLTDAMKDARLTTGNLSINLNLFGRKLKFAPKGTKWFNIVDQVHHLMRTTFKNVAVALSVGMSSSFSVFGAFDMQPIMYKGFEVFGSGHMVMVYSFIFGTSFTYLAAKALKLDKKSPKAKERLDGLVGDKTKAILKKMIISKENIKQFRTFIKTSASKIKNICNGHYQNFN